MSIRLYKENPKRRPNGHGPFFPKHTVEFVNQQSIDAVYYPFIVYENVLNFEKIDFDKLNKTYDSAEMLMLEFYKKMPNTICKKYRNYLRKKPNKLHTKPLILLNHIDMEGEYEIDDDIINVRTSSHISNKRRLDIIMPPMMPEVEWSGPNRDIRPAIGFQGSITTHESRKRSLKYFEQVDGLDTNFFPVDAIFGHIPHAQQQQLRQSFVQNLQQQIFAFAPRGVGNYSVRFFEALRAGRIPVLLDTGMVFPCEDLIDWHDFIICKQNEDELVETMFDWVRNRDLVELQRRCREIWENYLKFSSFLERLPVYVENALSL
ncbi:MAG: exostosin family protein [Myxococcota bacterium]|nr:exostosin family protein [Myxococcota bacterium]